MGRDGHQRDADPCCGHAPQAAIVPKGGSLASAGPDEVSLLSWNILADVMHQGGDWHERWARVTALLAAAAADIVCLQECDTDRCACFPRGGVVPDGGAPAGVGVRETPRTETARHEHPQAPAPSSARLIITPPQPTTHHMQAGPDLGHACAGRAVRGRAPGHKGAGR